MLANNGCGFTNCGGVIGLLNKGGTPKGNSPPKRGGNPSNSLASKEVRGFSKVFFGLDDWVLVGGLMNRFFRSGLSPFSFGAGRLVGNLMRGMGVFLRIFSLRGVSLFLRGLGARRAKAMCSPTEPITH